MTMKLRKLHKKDAPYMLEWMQDEDLTAGLQKKFHSKTLADCLKFIEGSYVSDRCLHLAVVDGDDTYMGTVSLKNINREKCCAEFAIAMRGCAIGKGFSQYGMKELFRIGWEKIGLNMIYWNVLKTNHRAVRFYDKHHYQRIYRIPAVCEEGEHSQELLWYAEERENEEGYVE